jgi:hypothetical protein
MMVFGGLMSDAVDSKTKNDVVSEKGNSRHNDHIIEYDQFRG